MRSLNPVPQYLVLLAGLMADEFPPRTSRRPCSRHPGRGAGRRSEGRRSRRIPTAGAFILPILSFELSIALNRRLLETPPRESRN